ncbi:hypothetical protein IQ243_08545 [Nostocales cyanobacterium LEGE 11386]|nr:hypothetical protein [Nostocales cyanobacterium LEGE 11386]MBW4554657.1 hypothetical protein [Trichormus sp. ATA11-4-KO1]
MKALVRWGATLGLVGSTLLGSLFVGNIPVLALSEQEIEKKLNEVPVFSFSVGNQPQIAVFNTTPQGQNEKKPAFLQMVFMNIQEAKSFLEQQIQNSKGQDPKTVEMVKSLRVTALPLGLVYQTIKETSKKPDQTQIVLQPAQQDVKGALALLRQNGQQVQQFPSVPVFLLMSSEKGTLYPAQRQFDKKEIIPMYLSQRDAESALKQLKPIDPKAKIEVVDIDWIIKTLRDKNDPWLDKVVLMPPSESIEYISTQQGNNAPKTPPARPQQR